MGCRASQVRCASSADCVKVVPVLCAPGNRKKLGIRLSAAPCGAPALLVRSKVGQFEPAREIKPRDGLSSSKVIREHRLQPHEVCDGKARHLTARCVRRFDPWFHVILAPHHPKTGIDPATWHLGHWRQLEKSRGRASRGELAFVYCALLDHE